MGFVGLLAGVIAGCPIFSNDGNGGSPGPGNGGGCGFSKGCGGCTQPSDCPQNETCGTDGQCHSGDCTFWGCPNGYTCTTDPNSQTASCTPNGTNTGGMGTGGTGTTSTTSTSTTTTTTSTSTTSTTSTPPAPVYCGHPADCGGSTICGTDGTCHPGPCGTGNDCIYGYTCNNGTCQAMTANACDSDASCASGSLCIAGGNGQGGVCTAPAGQCFDQSQCGTNEKCVAGKCTLGCTSNTDCRDGFNCNTTQGVCSVAVKTCTITNDCGGPTEVCVGGACVPRSNQGSCTNAGDVWDENGCIPNQAATFNCTTEGMQGACNPGSICLHNDCWISCDAPNQIACNSQPTLNTCKPVVSNGQTYNVCGTQQNLGSMCGAGTAGLTCSGASICIDGFCK